MNSITPHTHKSEMDKHYVHVSHDALGHTSLGEMENLMHIFPTMQWDMGEIGNLTWKDETWHDIITKILGMLFHF